MSISIEAKLSQFRGPQTAKSQLFLLKNSNINFKLGDGPHSIKFQWWLLLTLNPSYLYNQRNLFLLSWEESLHFPVHKKKKKKNSAF